MKPFLKPIVHSPSALTNRVLIRNSSYISNNSEYSINNNSATTNASAVRKRSYFLPKIKTPRTNQILKNANFDFFKRNNKSQIPSVITPTAKQLKPSKELLKLIDKADDILHDRVNRQNGGGFGGGRTHLRSVAINISKGISQKNYTINLL